MRSWPTSSPVTSQEDSLFLKVLRALPRPLTEAMRDGELMDPGLLMTYPRTDLAQLGLDGIDLTTASGGLDRAVLVGRTGIWLLGHSPYSN